MTEDRLLKLIRISVIIIVTPLATRRKTTHRCNKVRVGNQMLVKRILHGRKKQNDDHKTHCACAKLIFGTETHAEVEVCKKTGLSRKGNTNHECCYVINNAFN